MDTSLIWKPLKVYNHNCTELYDYLVSSQKLRSSPL